MSGFHMTLSPGLLTGLEKPVIIAFDEPEEATGVTITLWEADRWRSGGERIREGSSNDLIAQFRGSIVDGEFEGKLRRKGKARRNAPILKVQFDGKKETFDLPIPQGRNEQENGVFEIVASVVGRIGRRKKRYSTATPVFVRQFKNRRPIVAIIAGKGGYFTHAYRYWRRHADGVFKLANVEKILTFVRNAPANRGFGVFGELNIVSHGNRWEWLIRLFNKRRRRSPNPYHLGLSTIEKHEDDERLSPQPDNEHLDKKSKIVLRGCVLGQNQKLLDKIRTIFGDTATLYAPRYIQYYSSSSSGRIAPKESFHEQFYYYKKGHRIPNKRTAAEKLEEAYPGRFSQAEWLKLLKKRKVRKEKIKYLTMTYDGLDSTPKRDRVRSDMEDLFQKMPEDKRAGSQFDDWQWSIGIRRRRGRGKYKARALGKRTRIEVRSPLKAADGSPETPDLSNKKHYGRSPSW